MNSSPCQGASRYLILFARLVDWLSIRRQWTILTTNGRAFNRNRAELLKESGLNGVQVPLLAADPDLHDALSGRACWVQAVTALALALELGFTTSVTFVLTRSNAAELPHVIKLLSQIGVRRIIVVTLQLGGSAVPNAKDLYIADDVAIPLVELARSTAEKEGVQLVAVPDRSLTAAPGRPWLRWALSPNGELKLCNLSTKTLGHLSTISEADLDELASDLAVGRLDKFRDRVDTCTCFNRITQGSVHRVTPKVNAEATFDEIETLATVDIISAPKLPSSLEPGSPTADRAFGPSMSQSSNRMWLKWTARRPVFS